MKTAPFAILVLATAACFGQDSTIAAPPAAAEPAATDSRNALYAHPLGLAFSSIAGVPTIYLTYEREIPGGYSWTLQPLIGTGEVETEDNGPKSDLTLYGAVTAFRFYRRKTSQGRYFAPAIAICYMDFSRPRSSQSGSATQFGALGVFGYRGRNAAYTWYWDVGAGVQGIATSGDVRSKQSSGLLLDMNLGFGFRL